MLLEPFDFLMCFAVDLFEPAAGMPDQLGSLFDSLGDLRVHIRLVNYRLREAVRTFAHRVDRLTSVGTAKFVRGTSNGCGVRS
ncbi:hypothetical protein ACTWP6_17810 [Mycobacterium sp. 4D054]|uniref:hypothetical protein n=1 Tax=Mycobacterium sp. 4D054 TaxID=3457440 RepID=UPI003FD0DCDF